MPSIDFLPSYCGYLALGDNELLASVEFTAQGFEPVAGCRSTTIFLLDRSASMGSHNRMRQARAGASSVIETQGDYDDFAVGTFDDEFDQIFPRVKKGTFAAPAPATVRNKRRALQAIASVKPSAGTRFSRGLDGVLSIASLSPSNNLRVIFLTDGDNETDGKGDLHATLARFLEARFRQPSPRSAGWHLFRRAPNDEPMPQNIQVHTIGVGPAPVIPILRLIADVTGAPPPISVADATELGSIFHDVLETSRRVSLTDVSLRIWTPSAPGFGVLGCSQTWPYVVDLKRFMGVDANEIQTGIVPVPAWNDQKRKFLITLGVPPGEVGSDARLAGRLTIAYVYDGKKYIVPTGADQAIEFMVGRTDDVALSNNIPAAVLEGQYNIKLADAIQAGVSAYQGGRFAEATGHFESAFSLAEQSGSQDHVTRLLGPLIAERRADGSVELRPNVDRSTTNSLDAESSWSSAD
jgi:von Willebrand factor type A domain